MSNENLKILTRTYFINGEELPKITVLLINNKLYYKAKDIMLIINENIDYKTKTYILQKIKFFNNELSQKLNIIIKNNNIIIPTNLDFFCNVNYNLNESFINKECLHLIVCKYRKKINSKFYLFLKNHNVDDYNINKKITKQIYINKIIKTFDLEHKIDAIMFKKNILIDLFFIKYDILIHFVDNNNNMTLIKKKNNINKYYYLQFNPYNESFKFDIITHIKKYLKNI